MNIVIENKFLEKNPNLKEVTRKTYVVNISKLMTLINSTDLDILYKDYEKVFKSVKKEYTENNSQANKYTACKAMIRCLYTESNISEVDKALEAYKVELALLKTKIDARLATHIKTDHEVKTWITKKDEKEISELLLADIPPIIDSFKALSKLRNYVIFTFYKNLSTRTELADSKFYYDDEVDIDTLLKDNDYNYIILRKKEKKVNYILNNYKTFKKYGHVILDIKGDMYDLLVKYKESMKKLTDDNYFLLIDTGNKKMPRSTLSGTYTKLGNVIGRKLSIRTARHIKVSNNINIQKVTDLATEMSHDPTTALSIYAKK
jgi:hypothetical protein